MGHARQLAVLSLTLELCAPLAGEDPVPGQDRVPPPPPPGTGAAETAPSSSGGPPAAEEEFGRMENLNRNLTFIRTRTDLVSEYTDLNKTGWSEKLTLGTTWGFHLPGVGPEHEWGVRLQAPLVITDPGAGADGATQVGLGDVEMKAGWVYLPNQLTRFGLFGNAVFNTATDDLLGGNRNDLSAGAAFSHQIFENRLTLFCLAEYLGTATHEDDVSSRNALELSFQPIIRIVGPLSAFVLYKDKLDFRADDHFALVEPGVSLLLMERHLGLSSSIEIPIDDESYNFIAKIGMVWFY